MKKIISLILSVTMLMTSLLFSGMTAMANVCGDYEYSPSGNKASITAYNGEAVSVNVPSLLDTYEVTKIVAPAFTNNTSIISVNLPSTITEIGVAAFNNCATLSEFTMQEGIEKIGDFSFAYCLMLQELNVPKSVKSIGTGVFRSTELLEKISVAQGSEYYSSESDVLFNKDKTELIRYAPKKLDNEYTVPDTVTTIREDAFSKADRIKTMYIPTSVKSIGDFAFDGTQINDIYYYGTEEQWKAISVGDNNAPLEKAEIHYNYSPEPPEPEIKTGWQTEGGKTYYYIDGEKVTGVQRIDGKTYVFAFADGRLLSNMWVSVNGKKYYLGKDGVALTYFKNVNGKYYYFNGAGVMYKGWLTINGKRYYFGNDGAYVYRKKIGNYYYYFNGAGVMQKGWIKGGVWMYGDLNSGALKTGWFKVGGKWYWFKANGTMVTGWIKLSGKWYYLSSSGAMVTGRQKINGKWYTFNSSGVMQ